MQKAPIVVRDLYAQKAATGAARPSLRWFAATKAAKEEVVE
jgi:hypothetical protein